MSKLLLIIILSTLDTWYLYPQKQENVSFTSDESLAFFKWDIERVDKDALMFLDIPYQRDSTHELEYLTLTVAIAKIKNRPDFISIIVPSNINQSNGIFLKFANRVDSGVEIKAEESNILSIPFETFDIKNKTCTARLYGGYIYNQNKEVKEDVFGKFLKMDYMFVLLTYPDEGHKTIIVPLTSFKKQIKTL